MLIKWTQKFQTIFIFSTKTVPYSRLCDGKRNEPAKLLLPYLQRADELQKYEPVVAYYCRLYAMERGLMIHQKERTKTTNALLVSLMNQLERDKKSLDLGPDDHLHVEGFVLNVFTKADKQDRAGRSDLNTAKTFYAASIFFEILNQFGQLQPDLEQKQKYAAWKAADIRKALKEGRKPLPGPPGGDEDLSVPSSGEYDLEPSRCDVTISTDPSRMDPSITNTPDSDLSSQQYNKASILHSNISPQPSNTTPSASSYDSTPHHFPTNDHPSENFNQPPPSNTSKHSIYSQLHHHQPYRPEFQPQHYPNFQSYPSFTDSSLAATSSHYQGSNDSYPNLPPANHPSSARYDSIVRNGSVSEPSPITAQGYEYDGSYQPSPEQIAEAHKAARFAVGTLAFDDVFVAVDHLKKALELLTKPSAGH